MGPDGGIVGAMGLLTFWSLAEVCAVNVSTTASLTVSVQGDCLATTVSEYFT